jgi:RimJ/RimL family protein N-acetyltransferase
MKLIGEKIILRPILYTDFEMYFKWHSDRNIRFQTSMHPFPVTEQNEKDWFNKVISESDNRRFVFTIVHKDTDELIGYFQLTEINYINKNAFLGIVIGEMQYQGKGFGSEIIRLGLDYSFNNLGLFKISLDVIESNLSASKLYKKMGFNEEGIFQNHFFSNGVFYNIKRMAICKSF